MQTETLNDSNSESEATIDKLYDAWASTYDSVINKTRDLEKAACRAVLADISFETVIELGCGTGKNTVWLSEKARRVTAVDLSAEMLAAAKKKVGGNVDFTLADITKTWQFAPGKADLITCSLILEHVKDLGLVFREAARHLDAGSHFYICELHPSRQYAGSKARFETEKGLQVLECFTHHISDFTKAARSSGFSMIELEEWFDDADTTAVPRLVSFLFKMI